ncbi:hypothetical protein COCON_G00210010 [Conger conger]|uniref:Uncharacterized protein n=1 Tax=Conger conger TaxID=82655 RepID=A0A9Q1D0B9_CONCO|nr:hypothetical protein COCON_G00210010 [Conger conger]
MDKTGASQGDSSGQGLVPAELIHTDSGYFTAGLPAESQHVGLKEIDWQGGAGAEGGVEDQSLPAGADRPGSLEPGEGGGTGPEAGAGAGARGAQTGGDGPRRGSESDGHREPQRRTEEVCGAAAAEAGSATAENDGTQQSKPRRRNSNDNVRPNLTEQNPLHESLKEKKHGILEQENLN